MHFPTLHFFLPQISVSHFLFGIFSAFDSRQMLAFCLFSHQLLSDFEKKLDGDEATLDVDGSI